MSGRGDNCRLAIDQEVRSMIVKQGSKYVVKSHDGKKNLGSYRTRDAAKKRLRQIEFFKRSKGRKS
jgi:hypothetical protein